MFKKLLIILITTLTLNSFAYAGSDGELLLKKNQPSKVRDCFEGLNRATFALNQTLDGIIFKPVAKVYRMLPSPARKGVSNSLNNLSHLTTIPNNLLQGDFEKAVTNTGRFVINTTLGILGLIDVAQYFGLNEYEKEDYGQTFAKLGMEPGCYLVLPVLGPSTARDTIASSLNFLGGDPWYNVTVKNDTQYFKDSDYYVSKGTDGINFRSKNIDSFDNLEKNSMDFYASVRSLYIQDRKQKILNSNKIVETQDDSDWEDLQSN